MNEIEPSNDVIYVKIVCATEDCERIRDQGHLFYYVADALGLERESIDEFLPEEYGLKVDEKGNIVK